MGEKEVLCLKFGVCAPIEHVNVIQQAGFDYMECAVVSLQPLESDDVVRDTMNKMWNSPLPLSAFNIFLPGDMKIIGDDVDEDTVKKYLHAALRRVKSVGGETVVFGSGKARSVPDGFDRDRGAEQIVRFLQWAADEADLLGLTIVVEPLNSKESNIITSVPEGDDFVRRVDRSSIRLLADFYHMDEEGESLEHIVQQKAHIRHIHVADTNRHAPGTGRYDYSQFVDCLRRANYDGNVSIECQWQQFEQELPASRAFLRQVFGC